ncbi:MAG TPA: DUF4382 domain-containing protein [Candidatus Sulfotelmatobacter sp.]|nr:DUF4382 domain-containing protein [Candidatus Sulfotelmatobacter sp.]
MSITLRDLPPAGVSILSFTLSVAGVSLTPSSGTLVTVPITPTSYEMALLQTDSRLVGSNLSVPAGAYTSINVTVTVSSGVFINTSGATVGKCANGAVCALPSGAATTIQVPISLTLTENQHQWVGLDFNIRNAITSNNGITVDFNQPNVMTATTIVRAGVPPGSVDIIEDFIGVVTAASSSSITVQSKITGNSMTAAVSSGTEFDLAPVTYSKCQGTAAACITIGSTVSLDADLSSSGSLTASEIDVLDAVAVDEVEGIIYPTSTAAVVGMIIQDKVPISSTTPLAGSNATYGTSIFLNTDSSTLFSVDTKTLSSQNLSLGALFAGSGDLLAGQTVRVQLKGITSGNNGIAAVATNVLLRWSRLRGTVNSVTGNAFTLANIPGYINTLNPTLSLTPQVFTYANATAFDGITDVSQLSATTSQVASIRALYLNGVPPFQASKVRVP